MAELQAQVRPSTTYRLYYAISNYLLTNRKVLCHVRFVETQGQNLKEEGYRILPVNELDE
jgi:hypothetical protein